MFATSAKQPMRHEASSMMIASSAPRSLYATRWKPFLAALVFSGGLVVDLLYYFVWPTPAITAQPWEYQEPAKTILFSVVLLISAAFVVLGLYWTLTPRPLLHLSATELVYRPFPLPTRTIYWHDVEHVAASATPKDTSLVTHTTIFTLWFIFKPDRLSTASAARARQPLQLDIDLGNLSLHADELLALMRHYHDIQWLRPQRDTKAEYKIRRRNHQAFHER
jgi:hypothetical protein